MKRENRRDKKESYKKERKIKIIGQGGRKEKERR